MPWTKETRKIFKDALITDDALDKDVILEDYTMVLLSQLKKGDRFHEFGTRPPIREAEEDACISDLDPPTWSVKLVPL